MNKLFTGLTLIITLIYVVQSVPDPSAKLKTKRHIPPAVVGNSVGNENDDGPVMQPCTCGIFMSSQFTKGSPDPPVGSPAIVQEINQVYPCNSMGNRQCQSKCLEAIVSHLPNSANLLCASMERDIHKERAYLFLQNCNTTWINTNMAAGKEYCCKDGVSYNCPHK